MNNWKLRKQHLKQSKTPTRIWGMEITKTPKLQIITLYCASRPLLSLQRFAKNETLESETTIFYSLVITALWYHNSYITRNNPTFAELRKVAEQIDTALTQIFGDEYEEMLTEVARCEDVSQAIREIEAYSLPYDTHWFEHSLNYTQSLGV